MILEKATPQSGVSLHAAVRLDEEQRNSLFSLAFLRRPCLLGRSDDIIIFVSPGDSDEANAMRLSSGGVHSR